MKILKNILKLFLLCIIAGFVFVIYANYSIKKQADPYITSKINTLPKTKTGLLLGTSKLLKHGTKNLYFFNRINAAVELYENGKITTIIVSGDNSKKNYNEPEDMQQELIKRGIPESSIVMDFAGLRTLDSVIRARDIFGQNSIIIISQKFHNERAVFIARQNNIKAYGYNAVDVNKYAGLKTNLREYLAKTKAYWDLIFDVQPKFGGEKILIP